MNLPPASPRPSASLFSAAIRAGFRSAAKVRPSTTAPVPRLLKTFSSRLAEAKPALSRIHE